MYSLRKHLQDSTHFEQIPGKKEERWRLSDLHRYLDIEYPKAAAKKHPFASMPQDGNLLEIMDDQLITSRLPKSVHLKKSAHHIELTCFEDLALSIRLHYSMASYSESSLKIILQEGVSLTLFTSYHGGKDAFISQKTDFKLESGSVLTHTQATLLDPQAAFILQTHIHQGEHSILECFSLLKSAQYLHTLLRTDLHYQSTCRLNTLFLSQEEHKSIFACDVRHLADKTKSAVLSKQVIKDHSTCVFDATSVIDKGTRACEVLQASHALLLDEGAQVYSKPRLEIYSDDLKASHGSTVGELDMEALAYLQSRGIHESKAREILIMAFVSESLESLHNKGHKERILHILGAPYV